MFENDRILAFIPARGGSRGIPDKNIAPLNGKPLIAYSIEAARASTYIDDVIVSTDSTRIADIAKSYHAKVPFIRPASIAKDNSAIIDVLIHGLDALYKVDMNYEILVLLQPTQPLRTTSHIDKALDCFFLNDKKSLASVTPVIDNPILIRSINNYGELTQLLSCGSTIRRQDMPAYYRVNGCIYINLISSITPETSFNDNLIPFIMDKEYSVDIDDLDDLMLADYYLNKLSKGCQHND